MTPLGIIVGYGLGIELNDGVMVLFESEVSLRVMV